ncbi:MAG: arylamine N-acetyltransferase [Brumimicrobium sp.]|nr:arylamine N-acetyltransferase [Brumimicrobium sp.]MCO5269772.1 arylamine N-acetyltransferase [Brumimicrobium sp.]
MNQKLLLQYLRRIKFQGTPDVSLKTLSQIILRHTQTFAFENLNPLVGLPVSLELETIAHKFIVEHRGGYCFEHNRLLLEVFKAIGFEVRGLLGKVYAKGKRIEDLQRTHMIVLVSLDGKNFIADVGFGGFDPTSPIRLVCNRIQKTTKENFRIIKERNHYILQIMIQSRWVSLYLFDLQEQYPPDFKIANWYTSAHPDSSFTYQLKAAIATEECRYTLFNNVLSTHYLGKKSVKEKLTNLSSIRRVLQENFKIRIDDLPNLDKELQKLI